MIQRCSLARWMGVAVVALSFLGAAGLPEQAWSATLQTYDFTVFLGTDEIGRQRFEVSSEGERTRIRIEARFTVRFLYIPVYTYRHTNVEIWEGACLREIRAETDDNGASFFVRGIAQHGRMLVQTQNGDWSGEGCVRTFAYWNLDWLTGGRLLNSQTGDMQAAEIRTVGDDTIAVRGVPTPTTRRRIITAKFTIDLWHTVQGQWVALQSTTAKGDVLRYALQ